MAFAKRVGFLSFGHWTAVRTSECGARTKTIEIGTAVIDMRHENPMRMAEDAGAADLIAGGRLRLGISRGSPKQVIDGCAIPALRRVTARQRPTWRGATPADTLLLTISNQLGVDYNDHVLAEIGLRNRMRAP